MRLRLFFLGLLLFPGTAVLNPAGAEIRLKTEIHYYSAGIVRIVKYPADLSSMPEKKSVSVIIDEPRATFKPLVRVSLDKNGAATFKDARGRVLLSESHAAMEAISDGPDKGSYMVSQGWEPDADEPIYGLGMLQRRSFRVHLPGGEVHRVDYDGSSVAIRL